MTRRFAICVALVATTGCGGDGGEEPSAPSNPKVPTATRTTPSLPDVLVPIDDSVVTLIEPGSEPRGLLRYGPVAGSKTRFIQSVALEVVMRVGGFKVIDTASASMLELDVGYETSSSGRFKFSFAGSLLAHGGLFIGLDDREDVSGTVEFSDRGFHLGSVDDSSANETTNEMGLALLPEEPVGVGARWSQDVTALQNGLTIVTTTVYTLKARKGDVITLGFSATSVAPAQRALIASADPRLVFEVLSSESSGTGEAKFALSTPLGLGKFELLFSAAMRAHSRAAVASEMQLQQRLEVEGRSKPDGR